MNTVIPGDPSRLAQEQHPTLAILAGSGVTLRELRHGDAAVVVPLLGTSELTRLIAQPPSRVEDFSGFAAWAAGQRTAGRYACYAAALADGDRAVGVFHLRISDGDPGTAEWGFALDAPFRGTGLFQQSTGLFMDLAFNVMRLNRLEARAAVHNGRAVGALHKIGAVEEGLLRKSLLTNGRYVDQFLFSIIRDDWRARHAPMAAAIQAIH